MAFFKKFWQKLRSNTKDMDPEKGYDIWAGTYDDQPNNLMLALDEKLFAEISNTVSFTNMIIVDVGCGTGRHWPAIMQAMPQKLTGYDVSAGMLQVLQQKFPQAETQQLHSHHLFTTADASTHIVLSTLTMAHIQYIDNALKEWDRILIPGGKIIITDYHPAILEKGGRRTFTHAGETLGVKNYIHNLEEIKTIAGQLGWKMIRLTERIVDKSVKSYYEQQHAMDVYQAYKGMPVIYGMLFTKPDAT